MSITYKPVEPVEVGVGETLQEEPYRCHECSEKPTVGLPKELRTVESQVSTACILMAIAMESTENENERLKTENAKLRELFYKVYGYYVSGTLTPCDFCDIYCCEGNAPTACKADEYDPDGMVVEEIERRMRELGVEVD